MSREETIRAEEDLHERLDEFCMLLDEQLYIHDFLGDIATGEELKNNFIDEFYFNETIFDQEGDLITDMKEAWDYWSGYHWIKCVKRR